MEAKVCENCSAENHFIPEGVDFECHRCGKRNANPKGEVLEILRRALKSSQDDDALLLMEETAILRTIFKRVGQLAQAGGHELVGRKFATVPIRRGSKFQCVLRLLRSTEMILVGSWAANMLAPKVANAAAAEAHALARAAAMAALGSDVGKANGWLRDIELRLFEILSRRGMKPNGTIEQEISTLEMIAGFEEDEEDGRSEG